MRPIRSTKPDEDTKTRFGTITGTMGRKSTVPYGLTAARGSSIPTRQRHRLLGDDLQTLWDALKGPIWEIDRSASRGLMCTRGLYVFEHDSPLGSAPRMSCSIAFACSVSAKAIPRDRSMITETNRSSFLPMGPSALV